MNSERRFAISVALSSVPPAAAGSAARVVLQCIDVAHKYPPLPDLPPGLEPAMQHKVSYSHLDQCSARCVSTGSAGRVTELGISA